MLEAACHVKSKHWDVEEIVAKIARIPPKSVSADDKETLRNLERDGLVTRTVTPTVPLTVEYDLTVLGRSLVGVFLHLKQWADVNMDEVARARQVYDARAVDSSAVMMPPRPVQ